MEYKLDDIKEAVRVILDHNDVTSGIAGLDDVDTLDIDEIVERQIQPAIRQVLLIAPKEMMQYTSVPTESKEIVSSSIGTCYMSVPLPEDYIRFGFAKLDNWTKAVNYYVGISDPQYEQQWSKFSGVRATARRPLVAIVEALSGGNEFQLFPCIAADEDNDVSASTITALTYVQEPVKMAMLNDLATKKSASSVLSTETVEYYYYSVPTTLYDAVTYVAAALVAEVLKDTDKSNQMMAVARNLLTSIDDAAKAQVQQQNNNEQQ